MGFQVVETSEESMRLTVNFFNSNAGFFNTKPSVEFEIISFPFI